MAVYHKEPSPTPLLPDILAPGLDVIFVGAAPSYHAAATGHYYAGPRNRFWLLLHQSGFTPCLLRAEEDAEVLRYGVGMTGVHKFIASSDNSQLPVPTAEQRDALMAKLLHFAPRFVCYNGKDVYHLSTGRVCMDWGEQDETIGASRVFVVHSSSGRADGWGAERLALYRELHSLVAAEAQTLPT